MHMRPPQPQHRAHPRRARLGWWLVAGSLLLAPAAQALYKIVGPDGRVTYTDRPPTGATPGGGTGSAQPLNLPGASTAPDAASLPAELREPVRRYPAVLYAQRNCPMCDTARSFLLSRGIPFSEKKVETPNDLAALEKLTGDRMLPVLTLGQQQVRGYSPTDWGNYLDAAGYPKTSKLPPGYKPPVATPMVQQPTLPMVPVRPVNPDAPLPAAPASVPVIRL